MTEALLILAFVAGIGQGWLLAHLQRERRIRDGLRRLEQAEVEARQ